MKKIEKTHAMATSQEKLPTLLDCPQCHSFISIQDINEEKNLAKCSHCNHVFSYETDSYWDPFGPPLETQPDGIDVLRLHSLLELRIKHRKNTDRFGTLFTLGFSLIWNIMLLPFIFFIVTSGSWYLLLFISLHLFAGVSMLWSVLGNLFNRSTIEVDRNELSINTAPFAWFGQREKRILTHQIAQLYVAHSQTKRHGSGSKFSLYVQLHSGRKTLLVNGLDKKTLHYLETQLENYIGIKDKPV